MTDYKLHAILTVGFSGCGKSTWASEFMEDNKDNKYIDLERDTIRFNMFCDGARDWSKYTFSKKNEALVTEEHNKLLDYATTYGYNLVLSDTFLNEKYRNEMIERLENEGYVVEIKDDWEIPTFEQLVKRNENREGGIGVSILRQQYLRFLEYKGLRDVYIPDTELPDCVVVDVDGSVATSEGIRGHFEWDKVIHDDPILQVVDIVSGLYLKGYEIVFLSGRDSVCFDQTLAWLYSQFEDMKFELFMRPEGDFRKDYVVKKELFDNHVRNRYNVQMVIDDRNQVIDLWDELGLKVINVGTPYERF